MTSDPRKRSFPFPELINHEKRERRTSQGSTGSSTSTQPNEDSKFKCKLCSNKPFKTSEDFDFHLTMIHYRDKLLDCLGDPPYSCRTCHFVPTADDPNEEMVLHLGCKERYSIKFYVEECQKLPPSSSDRKLIKKEPQFHKDTVMCKLCNVLNTNNQLFLNHITQKHFAEDIRKKLPLNQPFKCPHQDCKQVMSDKHSLVMHYGIEHGYSMQCYNKAIGKNSPEKSSKKVQEFDMFKSKSNMFTCHRCKEKKFVTANSLKYHEVLTHFYPQIAVALKDRSRSRCPKCHYKFTERNEFAKHFIERHYDGHSEEEAQKTTLLSSSLEEELPSTSFAAEEKPLPKSREMHTVHKKVREMKTVHHSKARVIKDGDKNLKFLEQQRFDSSRSKVKEESRTDVSARQRMTDRWKSTSIDAQKFEVEKLQDALERIKTDHSTTLKKKTDEFERWIGQKEQKIEEENLKRKRVEGELQDAQVEIADLKMQLAQKEAKIDSLQDVVVEEHGKNSEIMKEKKEIEQKLAAQEVLGKELVEFQAYIEKMKSESKDLKHQLNNRTEEVSELKEEQEKIKIDHDKQVAKLNRQLESIKTKHDRVMEEKKEKIAHIKEMTKLHRDLENDQKQQISKLTKEVEALKSDSAGGKKSKGSETEKKEGNLKLLESQRNALLDSLDRLQKIVLGFESVIKDKNEKIQEVSSKLEETEINLEEALQKLNTSKTNDKEKKELNKQVKQLQATLRDYENRQFSNAKLVSGLEHEKQLLEKRFKDLEDKSSIRNGDDFKKLEKDLKYIRDAKDKAEQDLAKNQVLLNAKTNSLNLAQNRLSQAENTIQQLERDLRSSGPSSSANNNEDEAEKEQLKQTIHQLSERYGQLKQDYQKVLQESRTHTNPDDTSSLQAHFNNLKQIAGESQRKVCQLEKDKERMENIIIDLRSKLQRQSMSNGNQVQVKKEPSEEHLEPVKVVDTEDHQMVLNIEYAAEEASATADPFEFADDEEPSAVGYRSLCTPESDKGNGSFSPSFEATNGTGAKKKSSRSKTSLVDVTEQYNEDEDDITCGICFAWDPPERTAIGGSGETVGDESTKKKKDTYTTSWVGCDCGKWYHKECTSLKRFTSAFSCKSVKRKCQQQQEKDPLIQ